MKIFVVLTQKGKKHSNRGHFEDMVGEVESIMPRMSTVTVKWENGEYGRYHPCDEYLRILGYDNGFGQGVEHEGSRLSQSTG